MSLYQTYHFSNSRKKSKNFILKNLSQIILILLFIFQNINSQNTSFISNSSLNSSPLYNSSINTSSILGSVISTISKSIITSFSISTSKISTQNISTTTISNESLSNAFLSPSTIFAINKSISTISISSTYNSSINISSLFNLSESEALLLDKTLKKYNTTTLKLKSMEIKMKKITLNIILRIRFRELRRNYESITTQISELQNKLNETSYKNPQIIKEINILNDNINIFEKKYNETSSLYYQYERTKLYLYNFFKLFFTCLFILVIIIMVIIGIVSFFVVKSQRKYYKLQEEYSISNEGKEIDKKSNEDKIINDKLSEDQKLSRNDKVNIVYSSNASSADEIKGSSNTLDNKSQ